MPFKIKKHEVFVKENWSLRPRLPMGKSWWPYSLFMRIQKAQYRVILKGSPVFSYLAQYGASALHIKLESGW